MGPPLRKPLSRKNFVMNTTLYIYTLKITIFKEKTKTKKITVSKWQQNNWFLFCVISILTKILKTTFPKKFLNEIWLITGDYEHINIAKIKIGNFYSSRTLGAKNFPTPPKMLVYAIKRHNGRLIWFFFFCVKRTVSMRVTIANNTGKKIWRDISKICEKLWKGPMGPTLVTLFANNTAKLVKMRYR